MGVPGPSSQRCKGPADGCARAQQTEAPELSRRMAQGPHRTKTTSLERGCAGDDLDELASDDGLSGPVEGDGQLVNHLTCNNRQLTDN